MQTKFEIRRDGWGLIREAAMPPNELTGLFPMEQVEKQNNSILFFSFTGVGWQNLGSACLKTPFQCNVKCSFPLQFKGGRETLKKSF